MGNFEGDEVRINVGNFLIDTIIKKVDKDTGEVILDFAVDEETIMKPVFIKRKDNFNKRDKEAYYVNDVNGNIAVYVADIVPGFDSFRYFKRMQDMLHEKTPGFFLGVILKIKAKFSALKKMVIRRLIRILGEEVCVIVEKKRL